MTDRTPLYDDLIRRLASATRGCLLYAPGHPLIARNLDALLETLGQLHAGAPSVTIGVVGGQLVVADTPLPKTSATMGDLIRRLTVNGIERIVMDRGVTSGELDTFARAVAALPPKPEPDAAPADPARGLAHIRVGRITDEQKTDGIQSDIEAIRQLYTKATAAAETLVQVAEQEGRPDPGLAMQTVEGLADAVTQNRTALVALTAMKTYDNYTFTHMVNVSILTMGQARAIGIEGRLLREFGLSALMHDIGKVRTPKEILNKPGKLTADEFEIMKRHTVDGAEILRRTPEMPILAPVVAFEHHLRLDGTGYPAGARRPHAQPRHAALQHRGRLRRDALESLVPEVVSERSRPRRAPEQRRRPLRQAPGAPLLAAPRHLPAGQPRAAQLRRARGRPQGACAGSVPAARPRHRR